MGKLSIDEMNRLLLRDGYFYGLKKLIRDHQLPQDKAAKLKARLFQHILVKVSEAKKEVSRLQTNVMQMEAACRTGMTIKPHATDAFGADYNALINALKPFDGWTISLLESNVSLLFVCHNPETAGMRINGLRDSFADLYNRRLPNSKPFDNYTDLFDMRNFPG